MRENNSVTLLVNGEKFSWWQSVRISASVLNVARSFSVSLTRDLTHKDGMPVKTGDEVEVMIGNDLVLSGYITKVSVSYDSKGITISVDGSSYTVDMIDCCLPLSVPHLLKQTTVGGGLTQLASSFGVEVVDKVGLSDRFNLNISPVEKLKAVIERLIKSHSVLIYDTENGQLEIATPGMKDPAFDSLISGANILKGTREVDWSNVYSSYVVIGESPNPGSESTPTDHQKSVSAEDWEVRTRVFVTAMDDSPTIATMTKRAMLLKDYSRGSSEKLLYTVQGWRQSNGDLWKVNQLVQVRDGIADVFGEYLIVSLTYELGSQGTTTRLELKPQFALLNTEFKSSNDAVKKASEKASLGFKKKGKTDNVDWTTT